MVWMFSASGNKIRQILILGTLLFLFSCKKDQSSDTNPPDPWNPTLYDLVIPEGFPDMDIPENNPLTVEGIKLGRMLFYDPILSADNTQACASCHIQESNFSENRKLSIGIDGIEGPRNAMPLINAGWLQKLNWDGKANSLEDQAFEPGRAVYRRT